jgi:hypothetical protein
MTPAALQLLFLGAIAACQVVRTLIELIIVSRNNFDVDKSLDLLKPNPPTTFTDERGATWERTQAGWQIQRQEALRQGYAAAASPSQLAGDCECSHHEVMHHVEGGSCYACDCHAYKKRVA